MDPAKVDEVIQALEAAQREAERKGAAPGRRVPQEAETAIREIYEGLVAQ
jgi:hypothetical protein